MIQELKSRTRFQNKTLAQKYLKFTELLEELRERDLSDKVIHRLNKEIDILNKNYDEKPLKKQIYRSQYRIIQLLEKEHKIVPKNHYRNKWMILGMTIFGLPFGLMFGAAFGNMAFIGIGLPIGMPIGMALGSGKDQKAAEKGLQLQFEY